MKDETDTYEIGEPIVDLPETAKRGRKQARPPSVNEKLYTMLNSMEDGQWIPVTCPDKKSTRRLVQMTRVYFYKRKKRIETRYEGENKAYMRLVKET